MVNGLPANFKSRIEAIVGPSGFSADEALRDTVSRTTLPTGTRPSAIVWPSNRSQVQQILQEASSQSIAVYPISRGKNWGYGDACAPTEGCLLMDLSRMDRIIEVNTDLAYAVIEPGVTQGQLVTYLEDNRIPLVLDGNGAGPDASLVGNILERGFGHSRYGDRFSHCCNFEVVLANGTFLNTGFGGYPNAQAQHVYKHGIGPSLDGLFSQSSLGVITRMTIWLMPKPEQEIFFFLTFDRPDAIGPFIERLRKLFLTGTLRSTLHVFNDRRVLASECRFPWDRFDGKTALEVQAPELIRQLCKQFKIPRWGVAGGFTGSAAEVEAVKKTLKRAFKGLPGREHLVFLKESQLRWAEQGFKILSRFPGVGGLYGYLRKARVAFDLMKGHPTVQTLRPASWRSRVTSESLNPLDLHAGLIWVAPVVPMKAKPLDQCLQGCETLFHQFGFEFQVAISCLNERALCVLMSISFDHQNGEEKNRAQQCATALLDWTTKNGFIPYRNAPSFLNPIWNASPDYWQAVRQLKNAWDPQGILSPDHYIPRDRP